MKPATRTAQQTVEANRYVNTGTVASPVPSPMSEIGGMLQFLDEDMSKLDALIGETYERTRSVRRSIPGAPPSEDIPSGCSSELGQKIESFSRIVREFQTRIVYINESLAL